jgi:hypothetical protein
VLTGCHDGIDDQPREEGFSLAFLLLSLATPELRGSLIRLARLASLTPIDIGQSAPRFGGSGLCIVKQQFHFTLSTSGVSLDFSLITKLFLLLMLSKGGLWQLLRLFENFHLRGMSALIGDRRVDM